jgi:hypothetical protein
MKFQTTSLYIHFEKLCKVPPTEVYGPTLSPCTERGGRGEDYGEFAK